MARNGSGTYSLPAGNPVVSGTTISSTVQNNTLSDIATALTNSLAKNGETTPTANLPMGGYKLTGLAAGSLAGESVRYEQVGTLAIDQGALAEASPVIASGALTFADSTQMSTAASGKNRIINGCMRVYQRGSVTTTSAYTLDRWIVSTGGGGSVTVTQGTTTSISGVASTNMMSIAGAASVTSFTVSTRLEAANTRDMAGKSVTFSFWIWQNTGSSQTISVRPFYANSTDNFGAVTAADAAQTMSIPDSTWTQFSKTYSISSSAVTGLEWDLVNSWSLGSGKNCYLTMVQAEIGSVASPFCPAGGGSYGQELAMCQRYCEVIAPSATNYYIAQGTIGSTAAINGLVRFAVQKRTSPSWSNPPTSWVATTPGAGQAGGYNYGAAGYTTITGAFSTNMLATQDMAHLLFMAGTSFSGAIGQTVFMALGTPPIFSAEL